MALTVVRKTLRDTLSQCCLIRSSSVAANQLYRRQYADEAVRPGVAQVDNMMEIGTRPIFTEEHDMFRQSVRRFFQEEVVPYHAQWEKDGMVSREVWEKAGAMGILGVNTPEKFGGVGGDVLSAAITWEEQSYANCSGPGFALHSDITMPYITHYGTPEQIEKFIPRMTAGTCIGAIAMTEPGAGSDLQGIRTIAKKDGEDYILNGNKIFISNGYMSDLVIVVAITNTEAKSKAHGISLFLVEEGMPGFKKGKMLNKIGLKAQDTVELIFEDVRLPKSALLGGENRGFYLLMNELPQERLIVAAMAMASCEWIFEETRNYVLERNAFGKTISNLQTIQHKLAEIKTEAAVGRAFVDQCLDIHNERGLDSTMASMAKYWCSDLQNSVATRCVQMHGGWGYMWEYPIARAFVDARVQPIYGGSNEIMKELIARTITSKNTTNQMIYYVNKSRHSHENTSSDGVEASGHDADSMDQEDRPVPVPRRSTRRKEPPKWQKTGEFLMSQVPARDPDWLSRAQYITGHFHTGTLQLMPEGTRTALLSVVMDK